MYGAGNAEGLRVLIGRTPVPFCDYCGTQLSCEAQKLPEEVCVIVGVFDDPESFESEEHHWLPQ